MIKRGYLGEVLKTLRLERGLSLRDLGERAGLSAGYLSALELGRQKNPSMEALCGLATALGVSITVSRDEPGHIRAWKDSPSCVSFVSAGSTPRRDAPSVAIIHESEAPGVWDEKGQPIRRATTEQETHYKPDWTSSPGDTIADILEERGLTPEDLAGRADLSVKFVEELLKGRAVITSEVAAGLQRALGSTVKFWMAREFHYRKALAEKVVIGVDHGAGPDQQVATVWRVGGPYARPVRIGTVVDPSATLEPGDVMADWKERLAQMEASKSWHQLYQGVPLPRTEQEDVQAEMERNNEDYVKKHGGLPHGVIHNSAGFRTGATRSSIAALLGQLPADHPITDPNAHKNWEDWEAIKTKMKRDPDVQRELAALKADLESDPRLRAMWRRAPMYEAWKAERADSPIDTNWKARPTLYEKVVAEREKAVAERLLAELEAYKPLPRADVPQPDSDGTAPLGEE